MSEQINEEWLVLREDRCASHIVAISNRGNVRYGNGAVRPSKMYSRVRLDGVVYNVSHLAAEHFIGKTPEDIGLGRDIVDHITHTPDNMNVNDVRNLRWCTHKENSNFSEAKCNMISGMTGRPRTNFGKHILPNLTGRVKGANMNYYAWARKQFKASGVVPSREEYSHVYRGRKSEFAQWFNDKYGPGNQNQALYQRCYRYYKTTGNFLEE